MRPPRPPDPRSSFPPRRRADRYKKLVTLEPCALPGGLAVGLQAPSDGERVGDLGAARGGHERPV